MMISRSDLLIALEAVKGAVADKEILPILTHVLFEGKSLLAYDSQQGIKVDLPCEIEKPFNIKHSTFLNLVKGLSAEDVEIEVDKKIRVKCGTHKSTFTQIEEAYPKPDVKPKVEDWQDVPAGLKEAFERCIIAVHTDESNVALSSVYVEGKYVFGCSGKRIVRCTIEGMNLKPMLLSQKAVKEVIKLGSPKRIAMTGASALFEYQNMMLLARLKDSKYPTSVFEHHTKGRTAVHPVPDGFKEALNRLKLFSKGVEEPKVVLNNDGLGLNMSTKDMQDAADEYMPKWPLPFNPKAIFAPSVIDLLQFAECMDFGATQNEPLYFTAEIANFEALVMPMATL